jgi:two-component system chemotaxis sensor kinase CheA
MAADMDPSLIQDFLTEAAELIEQLDADLVKLEHAQGDELVELLNGAFRALHTIKGAASFLALKSITTFAHAAEDALNRLRKGDVKITPVIMDAMLKSADVVRGMIQQLSDGQEIEPGPADLIDQLHAIAQQSGEVIEATSSPAAEPEAAPAVTVPEAEEKSSLPPGVRLLNLAADKADLLPFMRSDLDESIQKIEQALTLGRDADTRAEVAMILTAVSDDILKTADFFGLDNLRQLYVVVAAAGSKFAQVNEANLDELIIRLQAVTHLTTLQSNALEQSHILDWPIATLLERIGLLITGRPLGSDVAGKHNNDIETVLKLDGVIASPAEAVSNPAPTEAAVETSSTPAVHEEAPAKADTPAPSRSNNSNHGNSMAEATIRVEVDRLESLLNLVGQLVLSKNRFLALSRKLRDHQLPLEFHEDMTSAASDLDRLTSELQMGVMRTRMQPLAKLFDRYPRVIRDVARMTGKDIQLEIVGKETEVDKSVLELLADPLVHILRNSADHGLEQPEQRKAAGKPTRGTIRLVAEQQGSHIRVAVIDDGKGMDRKIIGKKAVEKGLATAEQVEAMSDEEVFRFIFAAGFSTAETVTDLSGRGVGMDVVRTNVNKMNGVVSVQSVKGQGTTVEILIPLTVAILPAMVVGVGNHLYAIPLTCILEIVRPEMHSMHSVAGKPVMTLRESVLPLIDLHSRLGEPVPPKSSRFAVVVAVGSQRAGLIVDRLIGQQEVVIKPLDDKYTSGGPFSGATIREDGDVSLILDVIQLVRQAQGAGQPDRTAA